MTYSTYLSKLIHVQLNIQVFNAVIYYVLNFIINYLLLHGEAVSNLQNLNLNILMHFENYNFIQRVSQNNKILSHSS